MLLYTDRVQHKAKRRGGEEETIGRLWTDCDPIVKKPWKNQLLSPHGRWTIDDYIIVHRPSSIDRACTKDLPNCPACAWPVAPGAAIPVGRHAAERHCSPGRPPYR